MPQADVVIKLNAPHEGQRPILDSTARFRVVLCGRQFGKTDAGVEALLLGNATLPGAIVQPGIYWWVGLSWTAASMKRAWRMLKRHCRGWCEINETKGEIRLPNGSEIWLRTAEHEDALSGEGLRGVVLDEFTLMKESVWWEHIRPTLSFNVGWALFLGVPKGRNWGWKLWTFEKDGEPGWKSWQMPSWVNPFLRRNEIEAARRRYPEILFQQEYGAEFLDDTCGVFRHVMDAATAELLDAPVAGRRYVIGVDWGKLNDFTVIAIIDDTGTFVSIDRFNQIDYAIQKPRVIEAARRFNVDAVVAEQNSMGIPLIEDLQRADLPVLPFITTNASKAQIIDSLALAFEQRTVRIPPDKQLLAELLAYSQERLPSGLLRYGAPEGEHDDTVMALAFAWYGLNGDSSAAQWANFVSVWKEEAAEMEKPAAPPDEPPLHPDTFKPSPRLAPGREAA